MPSQNDYLSSMSSWALPTQPMFSQGQYGAPLYTPNSASAAAPPIVTKAMLDGTTDTMPGGGPGIYDTSGIASNVAAAGDGSWLDSLKSFGSSAFGTKEAPGWGNMAMGAAQGLFSGWLGMQQYGLAKQKLAESKRQYDQNYAAQRSLTNSQLDDRQRARVASNPGAYQSVGDYMNQYGVKA